MKLLENAPVTKAMVFAGCSFTWGQGLYFYSNMPSLKEPEHHRYHSIDVRWTHYEYMKTLRYPRLVADYFKQFEICQPFNGGATYSIIGWWDEAFLETKNRYDPIPRTEDEILKAWEAETRSKSVEGDRYWKKYEYEDISHVFYQFTQWTRSHSPAMICANDDGSIVRTSHINSMQHPDFPNWLKENNLTEEEYIHRGRQQDIDDVRTFLQRFAEKGIKVYVMSWPFDMVPYIKNDPWLSSRLIEFDYQGQHYTNIEDMMGHQHAHWYEVAHPELMIWRDRREFQDPPVDHHPSKTCHRVIADNIIKHLEKEKASELSEINPL